MKYNFTITKDGAESLEKPAMSFKRLLKSLITEDPKWSGVLKYKNKKNNEVLHTISNGKRIVIR